MAKGLDLHEEGAIYLIRIHRPEVRNAIDSACAAALGRAWHYFAENDALRVAILTGGDEVFSAGADLNDVAGLAPEVLGEHGPLGFTRMAMPKPTIAAIAGPCVAGGLEMACWCDLRIADESARFGCLERRFGVPLVDGGTQRLPRLLGLGRALELILSGRLIDAQEALTLGLVNRVVPRGQHLTAAMALAHELAARS